MAPRSTDGLSVPAPPVRLLGWPKVNGLPVQETSRSTGLRETNVAGLDLGSVVVISASVWTQMASSLPRGAVVSRSVSHTCGNHA
jgi:hypothetical protein